MPTITQYGLALPGIYRLYAAGLVEEWTSAAIVRCKDRVHHRAAHVIQRSFHLFMFRRLRHAAAAAIQRIATRWLRRRHEMATRIASWFRMRQWSGTLILLYRALRTIQVRYCTIVNVPVLCCAVTSSCLLSLSLSSQRTTQP